ncbi:uncharacterized protein [Battus philenor]|uniref:uncharacterized protein n=1 Tax=Battus philenor TaxID=42288 RepID=UPI0035D02C59
MIEIDPKLFVTCRLCLDNMGVYQIVPSVKEQIKFCYDIEVEPFDGLPQLICKKCESTLSEYAKVKSTYLEKQKTLKDGLHCKIATSSNTAVVQQEEELEAVSSTQQCNEKRNKKRKKLFVLDSDTSDNADTDNFLNTEVVSKKIAHKRKKKQMTDLCESDYDKWFICKFCNKCCKHKSAILRHINTHRSLLSMYLSCIKRSCYVDLNKVDNKPNICNSERIVVHASDRYIKSKNDFYYIIYRPKQLFDNFSESSSSVFENLPQLDKASCKQSSDSRSSIKKCKKKRDKGPGSRSSKDTVVVENKNEKEISKLDVNNKNGVIYISLNSYTSKPNECIDISDSTDSESSKVPNLEENDTNSDFLLSLRNAEFKTIQNIVSICSKKYLKRLECIESELPCHFVEKQAPKVDYFIKHKVLSMGRKVINNPELSCSPILKYLEYRNLEIVWRSRTVSNINKKPDNIRIMMKLKKSEDIDSRDSGWKKLEDVDYENGNKKIVNLDYNDKQIQKEPLIETTDLSCSTAEMNGKEIAVSMANLNKPAKDKIKVKTKTDYKCLRTLLNENPVANPKQLPRKALLAEVLKDNNLKKKKTPKKDQTVKVDMEKVESTNVVPQMPVITSTMSLAPAVNAEEKNLERESSPLLSEQCNITESIDLQSNKVTENSSSQLDSSNKFPRIKVKPVAELMSERALDTMINQYKQQNAVFPQSPNSSVNYPNTTNAVYETNVQPLSLLNNLNSFQNSMTSMLEMYPELSQRENVLVTKTNDQRGYAVMDSVDLPSKLTNSPFNYLKDLLQLNNLILLEANDVMTPDFINILKFKLVFQQESNVPVALWLALFYSESRFCIRVKDVNQKDINISQLSPNWQWEILKVYTGDVVTRLLENARKISPEVNYNTYKLLCLLKSIQFRDQEI